MSKGSSILTWRLPGVDRYIRAGPLLAIFLYVLGCTRSIPATPQLDPRSLTHGTLCLLASPHRSVGSGVRPATTREKCTHPYTRMHGMVPVGRRVAPQTDSCVKMEHRYANSAAFEWVNGLADSNVKVCCLGYWGVSVSKQRAQCVRAQ